MLSGYSHFGNNHLKTKDNKGFNRFFDIITNFVCDIGLLYPYNNEKIMQIHDNRLIAECTSYDFKEMLERKKVKSWLKSVSAFATVT